VLERAPHFTSDWEGGGMQKKKILDLITSIGNDSKIRTRPISARGLDVGGKSTRRFSSIKKTAKNKLGEKNLSSTAP